MHAACSQRRYDLWKMRVLVLHAVLISGTIMSTIFYALRARTTFIKALKWVKDDREIDENIINVCYHVIIFLNKL